ncbi:MAG: DUF4340 domain-containing protein [Lysobacterales bacterium]|jgi:hypothetical protein
MNLRFIYVVVLTVLALAGVAVLALRGGVPEQAVDQAFLPQTVSSRINEVDNVEIVAGGNRTVATLVKSGDQWQLEQMHGYRADWPRLRDMLAILAQARVVEAKTDNPEYYARLGVEDIDAEDAAGVLVRLGIGNETTGVIIGNEPQGRSGQYARIAGQAGSVQLDRAIGVSAETLDWLETGIVDVDSSDVAEVEIIHPDAQRVLVTRVSAGQADFDVADMPEGRELKSSWAVNSLGSALSLLDLEAVSPDDGADWPDAVRLRVLTFSGMEIIAETMERDGEYLLRLEASQPRAAVAGAQAEVTEPATEDIEAQADVAKAVDDINSRVSGWVYAITKYKYDGMVKRPEDLLKPLEDS